METYHDSDTHNAADHVTLKSLLGKTRDYLETRIDLFRLKTIDKSSDVLSAMAVIIAIVLATLFFLALVSVGAAIYLGHILGGLHYGFFIVGGFYAIVVLILYAFRRQWIKTPVYNGIVKKFLKQD